jgi:hypothetical protein
MDRHRAMVEWSARWGQFFSPFRSAAAPGAAEINASKPHLALHPLRPLPNSKLLAY